MAYSRWDLRAMIHSNAATPMASPSLKATRSPGWYWVFRFHSLDRASIGAIMWDSGKAFRIFEFISFASIYDVIPLLIHLSFYGLSLLAPKRENTVCSPSTFLRYQSPPLIFNDFIRTFTSVHYPQSYCFVAFDLLLFIHLSSTVVYS